MYIELYLDILFFLNFAAYTVLLLLVQAVLHTKAKWRRVILAAAAGSAVSCMLMLVLRGYPLLLVLSALPLDYGLTVLCFGRRNFALLSKAMLCLPILAFFQAGLTQAVYNLFGTVLLGLFVCALAARYFLGKLLSRLWGGEHLLPVVITKGEKRCCGIGLMDSGNSLHEFGRSKPVIVAEYDWMKEIAAAETDVSEYRVIPFCSVGNEQGILYGLVCDSVVMTVDGKERKTEKVTVALYHGRLSSDGSYQVLLHEQL